MSSGAPDAIVVGGGSAGCVVAGRLAEAGLRVTILEAGEAAEANPETLSSDGYKDALANDRVIWSRFTRRQRPPTKRKLFAGTGTGMGGSGSVNGMVYTRGDRRDYDAWPEGWHWAQVEDDFCNLEARLRPHKREAGRATETAVAAAAAVGFRISDDLNDGDLGNVFGYEWMNFDGPQRRSSYVAFVKENAAPENLDIRTGARATRLIIENGRAVGVCYVQNGREKELRTDGEVILCLGALETPKLLMLSGIGPADELRRHGMEIVAEVPEIGENLHDHPNVTLFFKGREEVDCYHPQLYGFRRMNPALPLADADQPDTCFVYYAARSSLYQAMKRMLPALLLPERLHRLAFFRGLIRAMVNVLFAFPFTRRFVTRVYGLVVILGKPVSRGRLRLRSTDPRDDADIDPAYFSDPRDLDTLIAGIEHARRMADSPPLAEWGNTELIPGRRRNDRRALERWIGSAVMTTFHFCGTCRMGADESAPVDPDTLRLRAIDGLRIGDASVVPEVPVSAMNAPSMLIGWRTAAAIVRERAGQASSAA
ncbi:MAG: GMC family oxidoreductase [Candidatus Dadabacteria bacterium]|nr:MAG: GMC family oxidoreductase [Candidatus Dadabacteria bacterium]